MQIDYDFQHLRESAATLDELRAEIRREASESDDPDAFGHFDRNEAAVGLGFVACQRYLTSRRRSRVMSTYDSGPRCGVHHVARVVHAGANYFKHGPEWPDREEDFNDLQRRTVRVLRDVGVWRDDYRLSNLLHVLTPTDTFTSLMASLDAWRRELDGGPFVP